MLISWPVHIISNDAQGSSPTSVAFFLMLSGLDEVFDLHTVVQRQAVVRFDLDVGTHFERKFGRHVEAGAHRALEKKLGIYVIGPKGRV